MQTQQSVCYLCKSSASYRTVDGFFDTSKLENPAFYADLPKIAQVHIVCSLLYKETTIENIGNQIQVKGLEKILKHNDQICITCNNPSKDFKDRPFILNCHQHGCFIRGCKKKPCPNGHCGLIIDLKCVKNLQVFDFAITEDKDQTRIKFQCKRHSQPNIQSPLTYQDIAKIINDKFPDETLRQQQQSAFSQNNQMYQTPYQQQQYGQTQYPNQPQVQLNTNFPDVQPQQQHHYKQNNQFQQPAGQPQPQARQNSAQVYGTTNLVPSSQNPYIQQQQQQYQQQYPNQSNIPNTKDESYHLYQSSQQQVNQPTNINGYAQYSGQNHHQQQPLLSDSFQGDPNASHASKGQPNWNNIQNPTASKMQQLPQQYPQPYTKQQSMQYNDQIKRVSSQTGYEGDGQMVQSRANPPFNQNTFQEQSPMSQYSPANAQDGIYQKQQYNSQQRTSSMTDIQNIQNYPQQLNRYPSIQSYMPAPQSSYLPESDAIAMKSASFAPQTTQENAYPQTATAPAQQDQQQIHDNTYSFNNTFQSAETQQPQQPLPTVPLVSPTPAPQKKILNTSVDTNPNGISGDYSSIIKKKNQQKKLEMAKPKNQLQPPTAIPFEPLPHQMQMPQQQPASFKDETTDKQYGYPGFPKPNQQPMSLAPVEYSDPSAAHLQQQYSQYETPQYGKQEGPQNTYPHPLHRSYMQQPQSQRIQPNNATSFGAPSPSEILYSQPPIDQSKNVWAHPSNGLGQPTDLVSTQQQNQQKQSSMGPEQYVNQQPYSVPLTQPPLSVQSSMVEENTGEMPPVESAQAPPAPPSPKKRGKRTKKELTETPSLTTTMSGTEVADKTKQVRKTKEKPEKTERKPRKKKNADAIEEQDPFQQQENSLPPPMPALKKSTSGKQSKVSAPQPPPPPQPPSSLPLPPQPLPHQVQPNSIGGIKSQDSLELASQTSLGNAVHRINNLAIPFNQPLQPQQPVPLVRGEFPNPVMPAIPNKINPFPPQPTGDEIAIGYAGIPQQQQLPPTRLFKQKTGPLINTSYRPLFVDFVDDKKQRHLARMKEQDRMNQLFLQPNQKQFLQNQFPLQGQPLSSPSHLQQQQQQQQQQMMRHQYPQGNPQQMIPGQTTYLRPMSSQIAPNQKIQQQSYPVPGNIPNVEQPPMIPFVDSQQQQYVIPPVQMKQPQTQGFPQMDQKNEYDPMLAQVQPAPMVSSAAGVPGQQMVQDRIPSEVLKNFQPSANNHDVSHVEVSQNEHSTNPNRFRITPPPPPPLSITIQIPQDSMIHNQLTDLSKNNIQSRTSLEEYCSTHGKDKQIPENAQDKQQIRSFVDSLPDSPNGSFKPSESSEDSLSDSYESFWEYYNNPDDSSVATYQHEILPVNINTIPSISQIQNQSQPAQIKKGKQRKNNTQVFNSNDNKATSGSQDPFFGINPMKLIVKEFPQNEDEQSVFIWWDQIDDVYFPPTIREGFLKYIDIDFPVDFQQVIRNLSKSTEDKSSQAHLNVFSSSTCSSGYYSQIKDKVDEVIPFKMQNYFSVIFQNKSTDANDEASGYLCIFKWKTYDKKRKGLTVDNEETFNKQCENFEIVSALDFNKIGQLTKWIGGGGSLSQKQSQPQDLSDFEPAINKHRFLNKRVDFIAIDQTQQIKSYEKKKATLKLKKVIALSKNALHNSLSQTNFLNAFLGSRKKNEGQISIEGTLSEEHPQLFEVEKTEIENNIFSLEYLIFKLELGKELEQIKLKSSEFTPDQNYMELRNLSVRVNDNLKWLTIRKNIFLGFSDRLQYDSKNYFQYDSEEKTAINLPHALIVEEKRAMEQLSREEQQIAALRRIASSDQVLQLQKEQHQSRQELKLTLRKSHKQVQSQRKQSRTVISEESEGEEEAEGEQIEEEVIQNVNLENNPSLVLHSAIEIPQIVTSQQQSKKKKKPAANVNKLLLEPDCSVCFHHVNNDNNTVVYCSICNASFHKHCYGIDFIPEERFLCKKCETRSYLAQTQKKRGMGGLTSKFLKDEVTQQFQCRLCTETQLPVITIEEGFTFYHPTCLFLFNYAIYQDSHLMFRDNISDTTIANDIKQQSMITCEHCRSRRGLKIRCCHQSNSVDQISGCNYYIHPLCAFLSGMEVWAEERQSDREEEKKMIESGFTYLKHLGIQTRFLCSEHAVKIDRNDIEQAYYRKFQINYAGICESDTYEAYQAKCELDGIRNSSQWSKIIEQETQFKEAYYDTTKIILNRREIEASARAYKDITAFQPGSQLVSEVDEDEDVVEENSESDYGDDLYQFQKESIQLRLPKSSLENEEDEFYLSKKFQEEDEDILDDNEEENSRDLQKKRRLKKNAGHQVRKQNSSANVNMTSIRIVNKNRIPEDDVDEGRDHFQEDEYDDDDDLSEELEDELGDQDDLGDDDENMKSETEFSGNSGSSTKQKSKVGLKQGRKGKASSWESKRAAEIQGKIGKMSKGRNMSIFAPNRSKISSLKGRHSNSPQQDQYSEDNIGLKQRQKMTKLELYDYRKYNLRKSQGKNYKANLIKEDTAFLSSISPAFIHSQEQLFKKYNMDYHNSHPQQSSHSNVSPIEVQQSQSNDESLKKIHTENAIPSSIKIEVSPFVDEQIKQRGKSQNKDEQPEFQHPSNTVPYASSISASVGQSALESQQLQLETLSQVYVSKIDFLPKNQADQVHKSLQQSSEFKQLQQNQQMQVTTAPDILTSTLPKNKVVVQRRNKISSLQTPSQKRKYTKQQGGRGKPKSAPDLDKELEANNKKDQKEEGQNYDNNFNEDDPDQLLDFDQFEKMEKILNPYQLTK